MKLLQDIVGLYQIAQQKKSYILLDLSIIFSNENKNLLLYFLLQNLNSSLSSRIGDTFPRILKLVFFYYFYFNIRGKLSIIRCYT